MSTPSSPSITNVTWTDPTDCGNADGTITVSATDGISPLEYSVDSGTTWTANGGSFTNLPGDSTYYIFVRNNGTTCQVGGTAVTLLNKVAPTISSAVGTSPTDCGVADGIITITANSSVGNALVYSIDEGTTWQPSNVFSGLSGGTYEIRVRNADATCIQSFADVTLTDKTTPLYSSVTSTDPTNCGANDGTITVVTTTAGAGYSIDGGVNWTTNGNFSGLSAGTYNVYIRNADASCETPYTSNPVVLTTPNAPTITNVAHTDVTDCAVNDGTITITATTGSSTLQYSIDSGTTYQANGSFTAQAPGTYYIFVRNSDGSCVVKGSTVVIDPKVSPSISAITTTDPTECSVADGTITITASGNGALEYSIDGGTTWQPSNIFSSLDASGNTYEIRVRNIDGSCTVSGTDQTITDKVIPSYTSVTSTNPSNCGLSNGTITVNASGSGTLEYSIDGGVNWQTNSNFTGLAAGNYNIVIRNDDETCETNYPTNPIVLTVPNAPTITNVASTDPTDCSVNDATITITATGGVNPLEYSIDSGTTWLVNGGAFTSLAAGTYNIFVRNSGGTCEVTGSIIVINAKTNPVISNIGTTNPTDCGQADGTITITASGTSALEYSIDGGTTFQSSNVFSALTEANSPYDIRVKYADGTCEVTGTTQTITDKVQPTLSSVTPTNPSDCGVTDGSIVIVATGGSGSYEYSIDGGINWSTSGSFTGLADGTYNVFIRNLDGSCSLAYVSNPVILSQPNAPTITNVATVDPTDCGAADGKITIAASGGLSPLEYSINGGLNYFSNNGLFTNVVGGTYQIRVRNTDGSCIVTYPDVTITDKTPPSLLAVNYTDPSDCGQTDGTITILVSAAGAVEFSINGGSTWQNSNLFINLTGGVYQPRVRNVDGTCIQSNPNITLEEPPTPSILSVTADDPSNCGQSDGTIDITANNDQVEYSIDGGVNWFANGSFTGLGAGTYNVYVRNDDTSCVIAYDSNAVILTVPAAPTVTFVSSTHPTDCGVTDGVINVAATGGTGTYQYSKDSGTTWQASNQFSNLAGGNYYVFIRNSDGTCQVAGQLVVLNDKVAPIIAGITSTDPSDCGVSDGTITITASSGQGSVEYSIDGGTTWQPSNFFTGLNGTNSPYDVRVRNIDGTCEVTGAAQTITDKVTPTFTTVNTTNPTNCGVDDGTISITAAGSSGTLEYSIDGGVNWQTTGSFSSLPAGTYNAVIRYNDGTCQENYASNPIILSTPNSPLITDVQFTDPTECSVTDGTITLTASGGTAPLEYSVDSGSTWAANGGAFTGLAGDSTYYVFVRNTDNTCETYGQSVTLTNKVAPVITNVAITEPTDCGVTDGTITITANSSIGNALEYKLEGITNWQSSNIFSGLGGGTYQPRTRNADGTCYTFTSNVTLTDKVQPTISSVTPTNPSNCGVNDGQIIVVASGSSGTIEYSIDGGVNYQSTGTFTSLGAGSYNVFVRYDNGTCITADASNPTILTVPAAATITDVVSTQPTNCNLNDGSIMITASGGTGSIQYSIDGGATFQNSNSFTGLTGAGYQGDSTYQIRVRNSNGTCLVTGSTVTLTEMIEPTITNATLTDPTNCGVADGTITITASSSAGNAIEYSIDGGASYQSSNVFSGLDAADNPIQIRVRNVGGTCIVNGANLTLTNKTQPAYTSVTPSNPSNCGVSDGQIAIVASGVSLEYSIDGGQNWQSTGTFSSLAPGTYNIEIRNGDESCITAYVSNPVVLTAPNSPSITTVTSTDPTNCSALDGTIIITATGGTAPLEYSIDGGTTYQASSTFNGLDASDNPYEIRVRNQVGSSCIVTYPDVTLTDKVAPSITSQAFTNPTNCGQSDGTITITANSSIGNAIEYSIDGGTTYQSSNIFSGLDASGNTYEIRVRNADGTCIVNGTDVTLIDKITPVITGVTPVNPSNCGVNDGTITVVATGGSGTLEYSIDGGVNFQSTGSFGTLTAGTYNIVVRYNNLTCTVPYASNPVTLTVPNASTITDVTHTDISNCGNSDGSITITATGGTAPLEYSIDSGTTYVANGGVFINQPAGTYYVFVRNNGETCIVTGSSVVIEDKVAAVIASTSFTDPTDCGVADGTITILASSSAGNSLEYSIDGGTTYQASNIFSALSGGTYEIRVRNADGTCIVTDSDITITNKITPVITSVTPTNPTNCGVNDGSITVVATGGSGTLEYSIDGGVNYQATGTFGTLSAGTYNVLVRYNNNTCTVAYASNPVILTAPNSATITDVVSTNITNCGNIDGTITITATGGIAALQYSIDSGTTYVANGGAFINQPAGTYYIFVRNSDETCVTVGPSIIIEDKVAPAITNVTETQPTDCGVADATITIIANSSVGNAIEYSVDGGTTYQSSNIFSGLSGGTYEIRVRNSDGTCVISELNVVIIDKITPVITSVTPSNPSNCGVNDGSIIIASSGGSGTLEYSIDGGITYQASGTFNSLGAGSYNVFVRYDNVTCIVNYASNPVILTVPNAATITDVTHTDITNCGNTDGTINITATGGTAPLEYSIDSGTTYLANGGSFSGVIAGTYYVFVRNSGGSCIISGASVVIDDKVAPVIASTSFTNPTDCGVADGTITITASSSIGNSIEFSIDGGITYQASNVFSGLSGGTYQIRSRNADGTCIVSTTDVVITNKTQPAYTSVTPINPSNCGVNDGSITIVATGASIEYSIDGGTNWQGTGTFSSLAPGTYNVFIRNGDESCLTAYPSNSVILTAPNAPSITNVSETDPTDCSATDGTITITASGGVGALKYSIDSGSTYLTNNGQFSGLSGGTYEILVSNNDGSCVVSFPNVILTDKIAPSITTISNTDPTDCGVTDGTITITASSGQGSIEYSINGGASWQPSNVFTGLNGGSYDVRVRNIDETCEITGTAQTLINKVQPVIASVTPTDPSNCGVNDGQIVVAASGASTQYSIDGGTNWQASGTFTGLSAGSYNIAVRNNDGTCFDLHTSNPVILNAPNAPSITNITSADPTECSTTDGTITISATGGLGTYNYSIDSGTTWTNTTGQFTGLAGGTYHIFVRNSDATCIVLGQVTVLTDKVAPSSLSTAFNDPTDCGVADGTITITATSTIGNALQYSIDGGANYQSSNVFSGLNGGTYQIRVRNADGTCEVSTTNVVLTNKIQPIYTSVVPTDPTNCGVNDGTITINATGVSLEYSIDGGTNWQVSNSFTGLNSGTYNVSVRNTDETCELLHPSNPVILNAPNSPSITNVSSTDPTDCSVTDGTITITATGGLGTYQYSIDSGTTWTNTTGSFNNLNGGTYHIFVRNSDATCIVYGQQVVLTNKISPVIATVATTNPTDCGVTDGTITITASSGQGSIEYSIDEGTTWQPSNVFTGLAAGTYEIRVRNIDGTCLTTAPDEVLVAPVQPNITNVNSTNPTNCSSNDGTITITATGAITEYSIDGGLNWQASGSFTSLSAGTYNLAVRNNTGTCVLLYGSNPVTLTVPAAATITNVSSTDPTNCSVTDGTITVAATGGQGSYEYSIDSGSTWGNTTGSFAGLAGGTYQVRVRNADETCEVVGQTVVLTDKVAPVITSVANTNPTDCGVADGTITVIASSSAGNALQYSIDGGATWDGSGAFADLAGGTYQIRVRNADGTCIVSNANIVLVDKVQPSFTGVGSSNPSNCGVNDGSITITATGGSLEYSIDGGTNWQVSNLFSNLGAGTYNVFVRNTDGSCTTPYNFNPVILTAPNAPSVTNVSFTDPTDCSVTDGTISITAISGSGSYEYSIDSGTTYQTGNTFNNLTGGTYCIFVKNADGTCIVTGQCVTLTDKVAPVISTVADTDPTDCGVADGTITITASSAVGNALEFSIDGGTTWQVSNIFSALSGGTYEIRVRNAGGTCEVSNPNVVLIDKTQPAISAVASVNPSNCGVNDGSITITATGASLEYSIDGGTNYQASNVFSSLGAGTYNVSVKNGDGSCETPYGLNPVILTIPSAPSITNVTFTDPTDCGVSNGTITISSNRWISSSYEYSIDGGSTYLTKQVEHSLILAGGTYAIRVREKLRLVLVIVSWSIRCNIDRQNCSSNCERFFNTDPTDCGVADGTITIIAASSAQGNALEFSIDGGTELIKHQMYSLV